MRRRADTGQHQQLRRADRTPREQYLGAGVRDLLSPLLAVGHTGRAPARQHDPGGLRAGADHEARPVHGWIEVAVRGRPAAPALAGDLVQPGALLRSAVEVAGRLEPPRDRRLHPRPGQLMGVAAVLHMQRAHPPVIRPAQAGVGLRADEIRQHVRIPPAGGAVLVAPAVVVGPVSPHVDHRVHRRTAAERLHPRPVHPPAGQLLLPGGRVVPVPPGLEQGGERGRDADLIGIGRRPGLQQQHRHRRILTQPGRQHTPGTPGTDDDVIEAILIRHAHLPERILQLAVEQAVWHPALQATPAGPRGQFPVRPGSLGHRHLPADAVSLGSAP